MSRADEYFAALEINERLGLRNADDLWAWITSDDLGLAPPAWKLATGENLVFRGQSDAAFGLSSKLYRDLRDGLLRRGTTDFGERELAAAEQTVIQLARGEGVGRNMTDGELLTVLQHHGVATRLLDVSLAPLEALFFAVDDHGDRSGRLFCFFLHPDQSVTPLASLQQPDLPWSGASRGKYAKAEWTQTVALVNEQHLDPRMRAQRGAFLVGGLNRRYKGDRWMYGDQEPTAQDIKDISTLRVNFLRKRTAKPNKNYSATAWTVRVDGSWKADLRRRLEDFDPPITPDSMYPPVPELRRLAAREIRGWRPART